MTADRQAARPTIFGAFSHISAWFFWMPKLRYLQIDFQKEGRPANQLGQMHVFKPFIQP